MNVIRSGNTADRRFQYPSIVLLLFLCGGLLVSLRSARGAPCDRFIEKRKQVQQRRAALRKRVQEKRKEFAKKLEGIFKDLLSRAKEKRVREQKEDLRQILDGLSRLPYEDVDRLKKKLNTLQDVSGGAGNRRSWEDRYHQEIVRVLEPLRQLVNRAIKFRVNRYAYEFLQLILALDPDNRKVRNALQQRKHKGKWLNPFAYKLARKGVVWHERFGWVVQKHLDRYKNGQYYDIKQKKWGSRDELNKYHRSVNRPWELRTEHLKLVANIDILKLVKLAKKLEQFYRKIFAVYSEFFSEGQSSYKLIFGLKKHPPLRIRIFVNKDTFLDNVPRAPKWSAGLYSGREETSYFYGSDPSTMYHEFTHQIFDQFSPGGRGARVAAWLEEGIATYSEAPEYNRFGELEFGKSRKVRMYMHHRKQEKQMSLDRLLSLQSFSDWSRAVEAAKKRKKGGPYTAAAALTYFCMEADDRKYRSDFLDYLKISHKGDPPCPLWNFMALSKQEFKEKFNAWCEKQ